MNDSKVFPTMRHMRKSYGGRYVDMYDISSAEEYGVIQEPAFTRASIENNLEEAKRQAEKRLSGFTERDYLLMIGDPIAIGLSTFIAARNSGGKLKILRWLTAEKCYEKITIELDMDRGDDNGIKTYDDARTVGGDDRIRERIRNVKRHFRKHSGRRGDSATSAAD